jgi:hypothetical protein
MAEDFFKRSSVSFYLRSSAAERTEADFSGEEARAAVLFNVGKRSADDHAMSALVLRAGRHSRSATPLIPTRRASEYRRRAAKLTWEAHHVRDAAIELGALACALRGLLVGPGVEGVQLTASA